MWGNTFLFYFIFKSGVIIQLTQCASSGSLALLKIVLRINTVKEPKKRLVIGILV